MSDVLKALAEKWATCGWCRLGTEGTRVPLGSPWSSGKEGPLLLVVMEGPSDEDFARSVLKLAGASTAWLTGLTLCSPPGGKPPDLNCALSCKGHLQSLLNELTPDGVVLVGRASVSCWPKLFEGEEGLPPSCGILRGLASGSSQVLKVRRLLERLSPGSEDVPSSPKKEEECSHEIQGIVGAWVFPNGDRVRMTACERCGRVNPPPKNKRAQKPR